VANELVSARSNEVDEAIQEARAILRQAAPEAAETLVEEMRAGDKSADRIRAAQMIMEESGTSHKTSAGTGVAAPAEALAQLLQGVAKMFGVTDEDMKIARAKKVEDAEYEYDEDEEDEES
jgi:vacuolar-type H+-ATPase subunit H